MIGIEIIEIIVVLNAIEIAKECVPAVSSLHDSEQLFASVIRLECNHIQEIDDICHLILEILMYMLQFVLFHCMDK